MKQAEVRLELHHGLFAQQHNNFPPAYEQLTMAGCIVMHSDCLPLICLTWHVYVHGQTRLSRSQLRHTRQAVAMLLQNGPHAKLT